MAVCSPDGDVCSVRFLLLLGSLFLGISSYILESLERLVHLFASIPTAFLSAHYTA